MTALPPPKPKWDYTILGFETGVIFGAGSIIYLGWFAALYPIFGTLIGYICDQNTAHRRPF